MEIGRSPLSKVPIFVMESGSLLIIRSRIFIVMFFKTLVEFIFTWVIKCSQSHSQTKTKTKFIARERGHAVRPVYVWKRLKSLLSTLWIV